MGRNRRGGGDWLAVKVALGVCGGLAAFAALSGWCCLSLLAYQRGERERADDEYESKMREQDRREEVARKAKEEADDRARLRRDWQAAESSLASNRRNREALATSGINPEARRKYEDYYDGQIAEQERQMKSAEEAARKRWGKHPRDL